MAAPSRSNAAWERVLAAIEADAAKAAALLVSDDASARAGIEPACDDGASGDTRSAMTNPAIAVAAQGIPSTWRLPATAAVAAGPTPGISAGAIYATAGDLVLPDEMPPIPLELVDRIERLRAQISSLQADLQTAMAAARASTQQTRPHRRSGAEPRAEFVDRRL